MLARISRTPSILDRIITGNKSWFLGYDPQTKRSSSAWLAPKAKCPQIVRHQRTDFRTMLIIFWDSQGVVLRKFVHRGLGISALVFLEVMKLLRAALRHQRHVRFQRNDWFLQHNNAPSHRSQRVQDFLQRNRTHTIPHPPTAWTWPHPISG